MEIPDDGFECLEANYFTLTALSVTSSKLDPNDIKCDGCDDRDATVYCQNCALYFCAPCQKVHLRPKVTAHHNVVTIGAITGGETKRTRLTHCQKHPHLELNSYCLTDGTAVCAQCGVDDHNGHNFDKLFNVAENFKERISTLATQVCGLLVEFSSCSILTDLL